MEIGVVEVWVEVLLLAAVVGGAGLGKPREALVPYATSTDVNKAEKG